jgi:hypothetical protein
MLAQSVASCCGAMPFARDRFSLRDAFSVNCHPKMYVAPFPLLHRMHYRE